MLKIKTVFKIEIYMNTGSFLKIWDFVIWSDGKLGTIYHEQSTWYINFWSVCDYEEVFCFNN